jgi:beta-glucosidase
MPTPAVRKRAIVVAGLALLLLLVYVPAAVGKPPPRDGRTWGSERKGGFAPPSSTPSAERHGTSERTWDNDPLVDAQVEAILRQMTLAEKIDLVTGMLNNNYGFYNNPITRLGIPALTMADGPVGVRIANPTIDRRSTQLPSASALAATWDTELARAYGNVLGLEAWNSGHNVQLAPSLDIARTPLWGRAFEGFGEDPFLIEAMAVPYIKAIQRHNVEATAKHWNAYHQEENRFEVNAEVDDRALHEIYGPPFEAAVQDAHVAAAMCGFNRLNGIFNCESPTMNTILKGEYGFRGWIMSDYNATPSTADAANNGLDQEQPGDQGPGSANFGERLLAAIQAGEVTTERLDDMVRRILRPMVGLGLFTDPPQLNGVPVDPGARVARQVAARGMVLLKNESGALPLDARRLRSVAVIGPDADNVSAMGGGSATVSRPTQTVSPLQGIQRRFGSGVPVRYEPGVDPVTSAALLPGPANVPSSLLTPPGGVGQGLHVDYWSNTACSGAPVVSQVEPSANIDFGFFNFPGFDASSPKWQGPNGNFALLGDLCARWTGTLTAPATSSYTLSLTARGDAKLYLDGQLLITHTGPLSTSTATVNLVAGQPHDVRIEYSAAAPSRYQGAQLRFGWQHAADVRSPQMQRAVDLADSSDVAVVVVRDYETEGADRPSLDLPNEQDELIRQVAAVNPRTIVVIETGAPTKTATWEAGVPAIVHAWFPGQQQGEAIADVLFGDVNPSGKLPVTAPVDEQHTPVSSPQQYPGVNGTAVYSESVFVGYRGYQQLGIEPQYPFGYGLSYTTFAYDRLRVVGSDRDDRGKDEVRDDRSGDDDRGRGDKGDRRDDHRAYQVRFTVRNTGDRAGAEVAQVYAGRLPTGVPTPPRQLAGFAKVYLRPGESARVTVTLNPRAFSYWDTSARRWVTPRGDVPVYVGGSSEDAQLTGTLRIRR